jgi:hypothetical protein
MKIIKLTLLGLVLGIGPTLYADPSGAPSVSSADPITEALPILQAKFPDFKSLNYKTGDHLSDLIARSNGEISLTPPADSPSSAIITANLPGDILYWRLATFTPAKSWADLETQLSQSSPTSAGIILDLRSNSAPDDYAGAAQVMALLDPANHVLAQFQAVNLPPAPALRHLPIVLLVNGQTTGACRRSRHQRRCCRLSGTKTRVRPDLAVRFGESFTGQRQPALRPPGHARHHAEHQRP